jgi:MoaA/NifB/PqqE/SkfB family radical SAM enzyme
MSEIKRKSFTAADGFPVKVAQDHNLIRSVKGGRILPIHVQLCPTNKCTRNCSFCSCSERDKDLELPLDELMKKMRAFYVLGCRAVTITGGGEPLLYSELKSLVQELKELGVAIGLVTNGDCFGTVDLEMVRNLTWCRISCSDEVEFEEWWWDEVRAVVEQTKGEVDWAFSYVVSKKFNKENLKKYTDKAEEFGFTHVRVVSDILHYKEIPTFESSSPLAICQPRNHPRKGVKSCRISLLKPVLAADGKIYPCCGVQYAGIVASKDFPEVFCMGEDIINIWAKQECFDGSKCERCYYSEYNEFLEVIQMPLTHEEFV